MASNWSQWTGEASLQSNIDQFCTSFEVVYRDRDEKNAMGVLHNAGARRECISSDEHSRTLCQDKVWISGNIMPCVRLSFWISGTTRSTNVVTSRFVLPDYGGTEGLEINLDPGIS